MSEPTKQSTYRWALYILFFLAGVWYGQTMATHEYVVYIGSDIEKYEQSAIGLLLDAPKEDKP
ncbi:MAG: hypothetical protein WC455_18105 [Dehalococcoidia bacterium]